MLSFVASACLFAAAPLPNPLDMRWTFGAHEPFPMYRRVGRICTGGIDGNAQWVKPWLDWWDAEAPAKMRELGFNWCHSRFYKGMGWEVEKKDFPNVRKFVANCHANGVKTLAYVQFGTLYPEAMRREIPEIDDWCGRDLKGEPNLYFDMYFRWMPCYTCRAWEDYLKRMCTIALAEGGFDGIMFDNVFDVPCYCRRCEKAFREHLQSLPDREARFGFDWLGDMMLPRIDPAKLAALEAKDPVMQEWLRWRADNLRGVLMRLRAHIKSVKPDALVTGNPSPYRDRAEALAKAQNMAEMADAFDLVIMQSENFPETIAGGRIRSRARDLKFAQDRGQLLCALCDKVEGLDGYRERHFLLPMIEDAVFGGVPTDRTTLYPAREEGFLRTAVFAKRQAAHRRFNAFVAKNRAALEAPTWHPVRIFFPAREVYLSERTHQGVVAAEEIFLRNRVPYGYLVSRPDHVMDVPADTELVVVPGLVALSDEQVDALVRYAKKGGRLLVTGESARYDGFLAERWENPLRKALAGLKNVVWREQADALPGAKLGWAYDIPAPADGGEALMAALEAAGWRQPIDFQGLPPTVFAEYKRDGKWLYAHLVNYDPEHPVVGATADGQPLARIDYHLLVE